MRKKSSISIENTSSSSSSSNYNSIIIIILILFCCCCISSITASVGGLYVLIFKQNRIQGDDLTILEYIDSSGKHTISSLPIDIKDVYYLNAPESGIKKYKFTGKKCSGKVCEDLNLKNVDAINIFYDDDDGNLLSGKLEYV